ncbi:MAG: APC family permease [Thermoplasmatales archaeon]
MQRGVTFSGSFMQSFTSIGPMLDIVALFSAIAVYSGPYLGIVMLISFFSAMTTIYVVWTLSKRFQSNGGYYLFAGKTLGKGAGIAVSLVYAGYALLVIPNIALFVSFFILHLISLSTQFAALLSYLVPLTFLLLIFGIVSQGLGRSIKYTVGAGLAELIFVICLDILFLRNATTFSFPIVPANLSGVYSVFSGVVFGILAFAGMESPVYLSENTKKSGLTVPKALIYSYLATGVLLVISAFSILAFLGLNGIRSYSSNPFFVGSTVRSTFGPVTYVLFAALAVLSSLNLCVAYSNSVLNEIRRMTEDGILSKMITGGQRPILMFVLLEAAVIVVANFFMGNFLGFVVIAAVVSFSYMAIQLMGGFSLIKLSIRSKEMKETAIASLSVVIVGITVVFSFMADISPGSPTRLSILLFVVILIVSVLVSYVGRIRARPWYDRIQMLNNLEERETIGK